LRRGKKLPVMVCACAPTKGRRGTNGSPKKSGVLLVSSAPEGRVMASSGRAERSADALESCCCIYNVPKHLVSTIMKQNVAGRDALSVAGISCRFSSTYAPNAATNSKLSFSVGSGPSVLSAIPPSWSSSCPLFRHTATAARPRRVHVGIPPVAWAMAVDAR